ncbi:RNA-binding S4 domain-containing protein [Sulfuricurvum sp.]|uniref:RNA-binding S4 domain-containing protein n=1 Tax=Sulfuricurvum sp. TaxID=2025608 RepID=UPI003BB7DE45
MRIDKFLNAVNLTKRRVVAQDMIGEGVVYINDKAVKPAKNVAVGDIITLVYLEKQMRYEVLAIPSIKSTPKSQQNLYIKELS